MLRANLFSGRSKFGMHANLVTKKGEHMKLRHVFLYIAVVDIPVLSSNIAANAQLFNGILYFTTNPGGQDVHSITYSDDQMSQSLSLGLINNIAALPGAEGIIQKSED